MKSCLYHYRVVKVVSIFDGDSCRLVIDMGFKMYAEKATRLARLDTPEMRDPDPEVRARAYEARDYLRTRLETAFIEDVPVVIHSLKLEKFGRALVELYVGNTNINDELIEKGHATIYGT